MQKRSLLAVLILLFTSACVETGPQPIMPTAEIPAVTATVALLTASPIAPSPTPAPEVVTPTGEVSPDINSGGVITTTIPVNPLTGLEISDAALLERRPVSVKVQIFPRNQRPPWGVSQADIIYDYYQNSGMTRFHAIYYGNNSKQVGPIRSGRLFDRHLVTMYKSILAFGGADRRILETFLTSSFADRLIMEGNNNCPPMCRIEPNGFNYLVTDTDFLSRYATAKRIDNTHQDLSGMVFSPDEPFGGQTGMQIFIRHSISAYLRWDYDPASQRYLRFQDTKEASKAEDEAYAPMNDRTTGQQLTADNVVILLLPHTYAFNTQPGNGEIIDILLSGRGLAYAFRNGQMYTVNWNRPDTASTLFITTTDGAPFPLKPGQTWFEVIGQSSQSNSPGEGIWRFTFSIP